MYQEIWQRYKETLNTFPTRRRPRIGSVIKEVRIDRGIRQLDFPKMIGVSLSTLKSIENDHQHATTIDNLERCGTALGLTVDDLILRARERDPANYFALKLASPKPVKGIRERKKSPKEWFQTVRLEFPHFEVTPCSPPLMTQKDFFLMRAKLPPKQKMDKLRLAAHGLVFGFIASGFNIKVTHNLIGTQLTGSQAFLLDGFFPHSIANDHEKEEATIYLMTRLQTATDTARFRKPRKGLPQSIDIAHGIERLRMYQSDRRDRPISIRHLAALTASLDHEQIAKLMRIKKGSSVLYWEKIEELLAGTGVTMEEFLAWCHHNDREPLVSISTATNRAMIDYQPHHPIRIHMAVPAKGQQEYFFGELMIEGKGAMAKKAWERKDHAMIAICVTEGELEVTVGTYRSPLPLMKGEGIYFDGNLGYVVRNPVEAQARAMMASYPSIQF